MSSGEFYVAQVSGLTGIAPEQFSSVGVPERMHTKSRALLFLCVGQSLFGSVVPCL